MTRHTFRLFVFLPAVAAAVVWHLVTSPDWALTLFTGVLLYFPIMQLGQSSGYHKLFAHNAFTPVAWYPAFATFVASISFFGDPLSSAMVHRLHHKYAGSASDPHNPQQGVFHAYLGWVKTWKPAPRDARIVADLVRKYSWMPTYRKYELVVPITFHLGMWACTDWLFYPVALACVLAINNGLLVNALSHDRLTGEATDSPILAQLTNPIFMHGKHHEGAGAEADYSTYGVFDVWGKLTVWLLATQDKGDTA